MRKISPIARPHERDREDTPRDREHPARNTAAPHEEDDTRIVMSTWDTPLVPEL